MLHVLWVAARVAISADGEWCGIWTYPSLKWAEKCPLLIIRQEWCKIWNQSGTGACTGTHWYDKYVTGKVLVLIHWVHVFKSETEAFIAAKLTLCTSLNTSWVTVKWSADSWMRLSAIKGKLKKITVMRNQMEPPCVQSRLRKTSSRTNEPWRETSGCCDSWCYIGAFAAAAGFSSLRSVHTWLLKVQNGPLTQFWCCFGV